MPETMTGFRSTIDSLFRIIPTVKKPIGHVHFRTKLGWTIGILLLYFILMEIPMIGISPESIDYFGAFRAIMGGSNGSIIHLGIGPIVMASIILQLLVGAKIINLNLGDPNDQRFYQGMQRVLVMVMIVLESLPLLIGGVILPDPVLVATLGRPVVLLLLFVQLFIGGLLILYMDEVVSKWGIGSGISLFILAGVAQSLIIGLFNWHISAFTGFPAGFIPLWVELIRTGAITSIRNVMIDGQVLALISTIVVFCIVVYFEGMRVEIPLSHQMVRGARGRYPIKLIYASVLPIILVSTLQAVIQMIGMQLWHSGVPLIGNNALIGAYSAVSPTEPISGLMYYLNPINSPYDWIPSLVAERFHMLGAIPPDGWQIILRFVINAAFFIIGGIIFAVFWVEVSNMNSEAVANQIHRSGLQIPGFRRDPLTLKKRLDNYIPKITVLSGALIGGLALFSSLFGLIGGISGTGMLLAVGIAYRLYEEMASQQMMEMYPFMRRFFGEE